MSYDEDRRYRFYQGKNSQYYIKLIKSHDVEVCEKSNEVLPNL